MNKKKHVLVTGGAGYIGSHTIVELMKAGFMPVIADNLSNSQASVLTNLAFITGTEIPFLQIDCSDKTAMKDLFERYHPFLAGVIHFAAFKAVGESVSRPLDYYSNNLNTLILVLEMMRSFDVNHFIFSSSCTVYGEPDQLPVSENTHSKPASSPYGNSKKIGEDIIRDFTKAHPGFKSILLRYFNPVGAHPSGLIGELPTGVPNNLLPYVMQTAAGIRKELTVYGNDYNTPDGTCIRDYIHVCDLASAHVQALKFAISDLPANHCEAFNIGAGRGYSVMEVIRAFEQISGIKLPYRVGSRREGDIEKIYASAEKSNRLLNWRCRYNLEDALRHAWNWQKRLGSIPENRQVSR